MPHSQKGVIIISIGKAMYGRMAFTLLCSIKNTSPDVPVHLIHDNKSLKDLTPKQRGIFDSETVIQVDASKTDSEIAFGLKTELYRLSPFEKTLLLDADNIMLPGRSVESWFKELEGLKFTAYTNSVYDYATKTHMRADYPYWADVDDIQKHFGIADDAKLPAINSSFVYFEKCAEVEELFRQVRNVWNDDTFTSATYRGSKTDEFCFNVGCAITQIYPHQYPYRPLYFFFVSENRDEPYIYDNFNAISVISDAEIDERIVALYNRCMEYYFNKFGFKEKFYFTTKTEKEIRKIRGFWHIATMNNWKDVVQEQLMLLVNDGLYQACDEIRVSVGADSPSESNKVKELFAPYPKIKIVSTAGLSAFEFPAIALMKAATAKESFYGFYFHTKGVSKENNVHKSEWRDLLNHYVLRMWKRCYSKVTAQYDVAGANWKDATSDHPAHFSGNFYWFDSEYIKRLPEAHKLNRKNRYDAEMWISKASPRVANIAYHTMQDDYSEWFPKRKIGVVWAIGENPSAIMGLLRNSGLLQEAHDSIVITGSDTEYDVGGFNVVAVAGHEELLKSYCILNPDAFIALIIEPEGIYQWKRCYNILLSGYDTVERNGTVMWVTASYINSLNDISEMEIKGHRKFIL